MFNAFSTPIPPTSKRISTFWFFAVLLFLKKSIKSVNTVKSYVRHLKKLWIQNGCKPEQLQSDVRNSLEKLKKAVAAKIGRATGVLLTALQAAAKVSAPCKRKTMIHDSSNFFGFFRSFSSFSVPHLNKWISSLFGRQKSIQYKIPFLPGGA